MCHYPDNNKKDRIYINLANSCMVYFSRLLGKIIKGMKIIFLKSCHKSGRISQTRCYPLTIFTYGLMNKVYFMSLMKVHYIYQETPGLFLKCYRM